MIRVTRAAMGCALAAWMATTGAAAAAEPLGGTVRVAGRPAPNVVVWLEAAGPTPGPPGPPPVLDQRNLTFSPQVLAVRVGTTVVFPNNDRVFHNVFSFHDGKRFDLGLYPAGTRRTVTFDHEGLSRIYCNIHPNMAAYVMAVDSPYFAVSDANGMFAIDGVVPGTYTFHAWRAGAPELTGTWTAPAPLAVDWR